MTRRMKLSAKLEEARDLFADRQAFEAALSLKLGEYGYDVTFSRLNAEEKAEVEASLMERAISRYRGRTLLRAA